MADEIEEGAPKRKKKKSPPPEEEDDEEERARRKGKARDSEESDLGNNPLGALIPLGTNLWALAAFWLSLLSCLVPTLWLVALLLAVISFFTQKMKLSYGSITGNMRAILAIFISLGAMVLHLALFVMWYMKTGPFMR